MKNGRRYPNPYTWPEIYSTCWSTGHNRLTSTTQQFGAVRAGQPLSDKEKREVIDCRRRQLTCVDQIGFRAPLSQPPSITIDEP